MMLLVNPIELLEMKGCMGQEEEEIFYDHEEENLPNVGKNTWERVQAELDVEVAKSVQVKEACLEYEDVESNGLEGSLQGR